MSISPRGGAREVQRLPHFIYYNVLKQESKFILGLHDGKIIY